MAKSKIEKVMCKHIQRFSREWGNNYDYYLDILLGGDTEDIRGKIKCLIMRH